MGPLPSEFIAYHAAGRPIEGQLSCTFPGYFQLWPVKELALWNERYEMKQEAPGYFGFGSNGAGEMLAFDNEFRVYALPFLGMEPGQEQFIADSWADFEKLMNAQRT